MKKQHMAIEQLITAPQYSELAWLLQFLEKGFGDNYHRKGPRKPRRTLLGKKIFWNELAMVHATLLKE